MPSDRPRPRSADGSGRGGPATGRGGGKPPKPARSGQGRPRADGPKRDGGPSGGAARGNRATTGAGSRPDDRGEPGPKGWGALARKGSRRLSEDVRDAGTAAPQQGPPAPREQPDTWIRDELRSEATQAVRRGTKPPARGRPDTSGPKRPAGRGAPHKAEGPPPDQRAEAELARALGAARASKIAHRLKDASRAYEREQFAECRRLLRPIAAEAPSAAAVRELLGLAYYRLGQWTQAVRELEAFRELTGTTEQHPVLADCYRALKRWPAVEDLWDELREASPSADLVAEGRIVMAGALADRRRLPEAIALLERSKRSQKRPQIHQLRVAYALADLKERAGDVPGARELFAWVAANEPDFAEAAERASSLR